MAPQPPLYTGVHGAYRPLLWVGFLVPCPWCNTSPARLRATRFFECIAFPASLFTHLDSFAVEDPPFHCLRLNLIKPEL